MAAGHHSVEGLEGFIGKRAGLRPNPLGGQRPDFGVDGVVLGSFPVERAESLICAAR